MEFRDILIHIIYKYGGIMNYKKAYSITITLYILGFVCVFINSNNLYNFKTGNQLNFSSSNTINFLTIVSLMFAVIGALVFFMFYKCPYCHKILPIRYGIPKHCPHCGEKLL